MTIIAAIYGLLLVSWAFLKVYHLILTMVSISHILPTRKLRVRQITFPRSLSLKIAELKFEPRFGCR